MSTQQMTARTMSMTLGSPRPAPRWEPSRAAQATRSLRLARRLRDEGRTDEYRDALTQHFAAFTAPATCPVP